MLEHKQIVMGFFKKNLCRGTAWNLLSFMEVVQFSFKSIYTSFYPWKNICLSDYLGFTHESITNVLIFLGREMIFQ